MPTATVGLVVINEDKVLLVKHQAEARFETGLYGLPAGRIEDGESPKGAASRELFEETGLTADQNQICEFPGNFFEAELKIKNGSEQFTYKVFIVNRFTGSIHNTSETIPEWVKLTDLNKYKTIDNVKEAITNACQFLKKINA